MSFLRVLFIGTGVGSLTGLQRSSDLCPWQAAEGGNRPFFSRARTFSWLAPCIDSLRRFNWHLALPSLLGR